MRRDEFTLEEYRRLHTKGRKWITTTYEVKDGKKVEVPTKDAARWYRTVTYNMILIACNTGMRPSELKNLRWRDISTAQDRDGRTIAVLFVQGKGKSRSLVAPESVANYLGRIRKISKATKLDDRVFTTSTGEPSSTLYKHLIDDLLTEAELREGAGGTIRSTYSFRHTYATMRLSEGVDVYFLAEQMGTSVKMIEDHYGHVNTIKHADRVLMGIKGWEKMHAELDEADADDGDAKTTAKAAQSAKVRQAVRTPPKKTK
jgi:integrase